MKAVVSKRRLRIWGAIGAAVLAVLCFGIWAVFYFYLVLPGNWREIAESDLAKLEQYCRTRFPTSNDLPIPAARRAEEVLCQGVGYDPSFGVTEYLIKVSSTVEMYVQGPEITRSRDANIFDNPDPKMIDIHFSSEP